ncbi:hypothetical protein NBRC116583_09890 [Arenicella sp. 4NH20-0111]|uniref:DHH family phosphoesterase n=1 Tax=Arenicella sp. 4NH20-0111 TaxID=3127648 RepID=UPI0031053F28
MIQYDCFNGDADGICALTQIRLSDPKESVLVTGIKRDIKLLDRVQSQAGDSILVLDISLDKNRSGLERVLSSGAEVFYCDHHFAGEIPTHPLLTTHISTAADVCTSLLINRKLKGQYLDWAVVGTFGDNLKQSARRLAEPLSLTESQLIQLENLGIYLNYNGYGASLDDLYFNPAELFQKTVQYKSAFEFIESDGSTFRILEEGYLSDMNNASKSIPTHESDEAAVYMLPNQPWARRVSGVFGNELANQHPGRAHAVITEKQNGRFVVSVRAPLERKSGADEVCRQFETGGGRAAAAGINDLDADELDRFIGVLAEFYSS